MFMGVTVSAGATSGGQGRAAGTICQVCNSVIHETVIFGDPEKTNTDKGLTELTPNSGKMQG